MQSDSLSCFDVLIAIVKEQSFTGYGTQAPDAMMINAFAGLDHLYVAGERHMVELGQPRRRVRQIAAQRSRHVGKNRGTNASVPESLSEVDHAGIRAAPTLVVQAGQLSDIGRTDGP